MLVNEPENLDLVVRQVSEQRIHQLTVDDGIRSYGRPCRLGLAPQAVFARSIAGTLAPGRPSILLYGPHSARC
jgi:hypothetical protein